LALPFRVVVLSRALSNWGNPNPNRGRDPARKNSRLPIFICFPLPLFQINYDGFEEGRPKNFYTQIIILQNELLDVQKLSWVPIMAQ
jgi:hypothetical protein